MRVGRINPVRVMSYNSMRNMLKYYNINKIAKNANKLNKSADIATLMPADERKLKSVSDARKSLNNMAIEGIKDRMLLRVKEDNILSSKSRISILKNMKEAKEGVKISSLDMLLNITEPKSSSIKNLQSLVNNKSDYTDLNVDTFNKNIIDKSPMKNNLESKKTGLETMKQNVDKDKNSIVNNKTQDKKNSYLEEYENMLKNLQETKDKKKEQQKIEKSKQDELKINNKN